MRSLIVTSPAVLGTDEAKVYCCVLSMPLQEELKDMLNVQEGFVFDFQDIVDDRRKLEM